MKTWQVKLLGGICDIIGGGTPSKRNAAFYRGNIPWATVRDMGKMILDKTEFSITREAVDSSATNIIPKGNVVIASRVGLGKVCILKNDTAINQDLRAVIPKSNNLSKEYLFWWFSSISDYIVSQGNGATVKGVTLPFLKSLSIPVPPLPEQKRIVEILDAAFGKIDAVQRNAERNLANAKELFQRVLDEEMTPKKGWGEHSLKEVGTTITGQTPSTKDPLNFGHDIPFIKPADIVPFEKINYENEGLSFQGVSKSRLIKNDSVLMVCIGASIGKVGYATQDVTCNQQINAVVPKSPYYGKFVYYALSSTAFQMSVIKNAAQATLPIISKSKWEALSIAIPADEKKQAAIARKLDGLLENCNSCNRNYINLLSKTVALKQQILSKAFNGEL